MDRRSQKCKDAFHAFFKTFLFLLFIYVESPLKAFAIGETPSQAEASLLAQPSDGSLPIEVDRLLTAFAKDLGKFRDLMGPKLSPTLKTQFQRRIQQVASKTLKESVDYQVYPGGQVTIDLKDTKADWMHLVEGKSGWVQAYFSIAGNSNPFDGCHYLVQKSRPQSATIECKRIFPKERGGVIWAAASTRLDWMF